MMMKKMMKMMMKIQKPQRQPGPPKTDDSTGPLIQVVMTKVIGGTRRSWYRQRIGDLCY